MYYHVMCLLRIAIKQLSFLQALRHMWAETCGGSYVSCNKSSNYVGKQSRPLLATLIAYR